MIKVAITGPESVGKSTLSQVLAKHFNGIFVTEFARDYIHNLNRKYTYSDVEVIAKRQIEDYDRMINSSIYPIVFFDTFLIITKVWFEFVWNKSPEWLEDAIEQKSMDMYLLCKPDIPWESDDVRENGDIREELFNRYESLLTNYDLKYEVLDGVGDVRVENAIKIIENKI